MQGAVYVTDNGAYTWQAAVQETVDGTLNRTVSSGKPSGMLMSVQLPNRAETIVGRS